MIRRHQVAERDGGGRSQHEDVAPGVARIAFPRHPHPSGEPCHHVRGGRLVQGHQLAALALIDSRADPAGAENSSHPVGATRRVAAESPYIALLSLFLVFARRPYLSPPPGLLPIEATT